MSFKSFNKTNTVRGANPWTAEPVGAEPPTEYDAEKRPSLLAYVAVNLMLNGESLMIIQNIEVIESKDGGMFATMPSRLIGKDDNGKWQSSDFLVFDDTRAYRPIMDAARTAYKIAIGEVEAAPEVTMDEEIPF
jgi:DNA-binding cell septation regulator SpoVG